MGFYIFKQNTGKIELHLCRAEYLELPEMLKKEIKGSYFFKEDVGAWVSRAEFPNLQEAEKVLKKLGFDDEEQTGENTFMLQDIRCRKRYADSRWDRMFAAWKKGYDDFKNSEYYAEKLKVIRKTGGYMQSSDKGFINRKIQENERNIYKYKKCLENCYDKLEKIKQGQTFTEHDGTLITKETIHRRIEMTKTSIDIEIAKAVYYYQCLEKMGEAAFSPKNVKNGYIVGIAGLPLLKRQKKELPSNLEKTGLLPENQKSAGIIQHLKVFCGQLK